MTLIGPAEYIAQVYRLPDTRRPLRFPDDFETTPEGLLALGGNLHPETLLNAYEKGIFPWFNEGEPILWWHPDPRLVLFPDQVHVSHKMRTFMKRGLYHVSFNLNFPGVMAACAAKRGKARTGTWITDGLQDAFVELHHQGFAHSVEVYSTDNRLVGGMYGLALGKIFFGESMFSDEDNTSKLALIMLCEKLVQHDFFCLDCQVESAHLLSLGAELIPREEFLDALTKGRTSSRERVRFTNPATT